jgi:hypothetical protein
VERIQNNQMNQVNPLKFNNFYVSLLIYYIPAE